MVAFLTTFLARAARGLALGALPVACVWSGSGPAAAQVRSQVELPPAPRPVVGRPFVWRLPTGGPAAGTTAARAAGPAAILALARQQFGLTSADSLRFEREEVDARGERHQRYQQWHHGIPVEHGQLTTHYQGIRLAGLSGELKAPPQGVTPRLTEAVARQQALAAVGATRYMWQDPADEAALRLLLHDPTASYFPTGSLTWVEDWLSPIRRGVVLAWRFDIYAAEPLSREWVYVDAATGEVVLRDKLLCTAHSPTAARRTLGPPAAAGPAAATGTFATRYSGSRTGLTSVGANGRYVLRDSTRGGGVFTYDSRRAGSFATWFDFSDNDNNWTAAEHNNARKDNAALDAHWGTQMVYDYWKTVHGRNSFDGVGTPLTSFVHFGSGFENAFWNGRWMAYGDGNRIFTPLTSLDIVGHEIGHGVCQFTAHLVSEGRMRHPAAMNEGFSDIWGACVEHFADSTKDIWEAGNEVTVGGWSMRSLRDPKSSFQPDTYRGQYWVEHIYAAPQHISTILSHWFYLLSEGGTGTNDVGSTYTVAGLGIRRAARIAWHTESLYLTPTSNYPDCYRAALAAATDLYGDDSPEVRASAAAWYAVGVGDAPPQLLTVAPAQGAVGATVLLTGRYFSPVRRVLFNGVHAPDFTVLDSVRLVVRVPVGATTGRVQVVAPMGTATSAADFVVTSQGPPPVITSFSPAAGQRVGATLTITGQELSGTSSVRIGGAPATGVTVQSATRVTAVVPPLAVTGPLTLETPGGIATAPDVCRVLPTVSGFSPISGPVGTRVVVTGTGLTGATAAWVHDSTAALLPGGTAAALTLVVPPAATSGPLRVQTAGGVASSMGVFTVTASVAPVITGFSPATGGPNTTVTIRGTNLLGTDEVRFGGRIVAAGFTVLNDTTLTAVVPLLARTGPITLTTPGGLATSATSFTVTATSCRLTAAIETDGPACVPVGGNLRLRATTQGGALTPTYSVAPLAFAPQPEPDSVAPIFSWGMGATGLPIGFSFQFFGRTVTTFNLSASGNMQFGGREWAAGNYAEVPFPLAPNNFISLAWSGWNPQAGGRIRYGVQGAAPSRQLVVSYYRVPHLLSLYDSLTAQLVLHETSNEIDFIYTSTGQHPMYMTVGAENNTGTVGAQIPGRSGQVLWRADSIAWRLTPASVAAPLTYQWSPTTGLTDTTSATLLVAPTVPTTYTVTIRDGVCIRAASVLVTPAPAAPPAAAPRARCGAGTVTLTATGAPAGGGYEWFADPVSGAVLGTGAGFTTPNLTATTTYYVGTVSAGGCTSATRTPRTALIAAPATVPTAVAAPAALTLGQSTELRVEFPQPGAAYTWRGPGLAAAGAVGARVVAVPPTAGAATYTVTAVAAAMCGAAAPAAVVVTVGTPPVVPVLTGFAPTSGPVGHVVVLNGAGFAAVTSVGFTGPGGATIPAPIRARTATTLTVAVPVGALPGALRLTYAGGTVVSADPFCVELRALGGTGRRCGPGPVVITANGAPAGGSYRWYDVPVGGTPLGVTTTGSFTTPAISATRQFYVAVVAGSGAGACEGLRATVLATIMPVPVPTIGAASSTTFCEGTGLWLYSAGCTEVVWNTGETTWSIFVDSSGTYSFTGTMYGMCPVASDPVEIVVTPHPVATFAYADSLACQGEPDPAPVVSGTPGGRFAATPAGLSLDSLTGAVATAASVPGTYRITYTATTACVDTARLTRGFTVLARPAAPAISQAPGPTGGILLTSSAAVGNQWLFNGVPISGATGPTYLVATSAGNGQYTVLVTDSAGCVSAVSAPATVIITGLADAAAVPTLTLAPNPVALGHPARLTVVGAGAGRAVLVRDVLGRLVSRAALPAPAAGASVVEVPTRGLTPGVYTLSVGERTCRLVVE